MKKGKTRYNQSVTTLSLTAHDEARYRRFLKLNPSMTAASYLRALVMQDICEYEVEHGLPQLPNDIDPWSQADMFEAKKSERYMTGLTPKQARDFEIACHIRGVKMSDALRSLAVDFSTKVQNQNPELFKQLIQLTEDK